ncbi:hypothetical protein BGX28_002822 [Mortierella sp. GBA30]|nr:hypothetical protein BGX28_002822 [Mortierella sp. GBA30]
MRYQAQKRDQEKKSSPYLQELEETRASLKGLTTALEFIQAEQENLVERVMSVDEQQSKLEAMSKASRMADQRMAQLKLTLERLIEMTRLCCMSIPMTAGDISDGIMRSLSNGIPQFSGLVHDQISTVERDAAALEGLSKESQQRHAANHVHTLQAPVLDALGSETFSDHIPSERCLVTPVGSLSLDQHVLRMAGLQKHSLVQDLCFSKAKELNEHMTRGKDRTVSMIKSSASDLLRNSTPPHDDSGGVDGKDDSTDDVMNSESLASQFELDIRDIALSITNLDRTHRLHFKYNIQDAITSTEAGSAAVNELHGLIQDRDRISALSTTAQRGQKTLSSPKELDRKRPRYSQK